MHPVVCEIGPIIIYSYGIMLGIAAVSGYFLWANLAIARGYDWGRLRIIALFVIGAGLIGAKLLGLLTSPSQELTALDSGLAFYGVPFLAVPTFWLGARIAKLDPLPNAELLIVSVALAQSIGRIGCFLAGCCFGAPTSWSMAVTFEWPIVPQHLHSIPLHPIQLYSALTEFILFLWLYRYLHRPHQPGEVVLLYFIGYGTLRFFQEFLRGDDLARGLWVGISTSQIISIILVLVAFPLFLRLRRSPAQQTSKNTTKL